MEGGGDPESQTLNDQSPLIIRQVLMKFKAKVRHL